MLSSEDLVTPSNEDKRHRFADERPLWMTLAAGDQADSRHS